MNIFRQCRKKTSWTHRRDIAAVIRFAWIVIPVILFSVMNLAATEIDRLLVAVNGSVITEGDLYIARNLKALFSEDNSVESISSEDELERLIDLELIRQEMDNLSIDLEDEGGVSAWMEDLRIRFEGEEELDRRLDKLGLEESELISFLRFEISLLKFVDFRFRPFTPGVSSEEIEAYYQNVLLPQLEASGLEKPPMEAVTAEIKEILEELQVNADLDQWIMDARRNARIEYFTDSISPDGGNFPEPENSRESVRNETTE